MTFKISQAAHHQQNSRMDEYSESIRKKMQSIKADTDQIFATINKHEKENKDANTISKKERSILDLQEDASTLRFVR